MVFVGIGARIKASPRVTGQARSYPNRSNLDSVLVIVNGEVVNVKIKANPLVNGCCCGTLQSRQGLDSKLSAARLSVMRLSAVRLSMVRFF